MRWLAWCSHDHAQAEGNMSPESAVVDFPGYIFLVIWGVAIAFANGKAKTNFPPKLAELKPNTLCKRCLVAEGALLTTFSLFSAIPLLASGILGALADEREMPCFKAHACPHVDRLCEHAKAISKVHSGSCLHWSLHHPGVMLLSHDGRLKVNV